MAGSGKAHLREDDVILRVEDLTVEYPLGRGRKVHAVSGISFDVKRGETLGFVGESGCGKSTTGRAVLHLQDYSGGEITVNGAQLSKMSAGELRQARTEMQMIFQDPISALNPRRKVKDIVREPLNVWKRLEKADEKVDNLLADVGIDPALAGGRRPHQFSGGQCQRIAIARALVLEPSLLVCDEPVSALDVSVQAQILNLLEDMKERYGLSMVFIAHDVAVVKNISDRIAVMYMGKLCEVGPSDAVATSPAHPYTNTLIAAVPIPDPDHPLVEQALPGEPVSPVSPPSGCRFRTRCPRALDQCAVDEPQMREVGEGHFVACHNPEVMQIGSAVPAAEGSLV